MRQRVIAGLPPVYDRCVEVFGAEAIVGRPILWAWGDRIYNPLGVDIPRELMAHERVHGERQGSSDAQIREWWDQYLVDREFRFKEELLAHRAEWRTYQRWHPGQDGQPMLDAMAARLASEMYGRMVPAAAARHAILARG